MLNPVTSSDCLLAADTITTNHFFVKDQHPMAGYSDKHLLTEHNDVYWPTSTIDTDSAKCCSFI